MKLLEVLRRSTDYLKERGVDSPRLSSELLMAHVLKKRRLDLYLEFERILNEDELKELRELVQKRGRRIPLQHLLGETVFYGLKLFTTPQALIPRPETEVLVDLALQISKEIFPGLIYDIGTGSGAIALALASHLKNLVDANGSVDASWRIVASDISAEALELAKKNHELYPDLKIEWHKASLLDHATEPAAIVIANLPYLTSKEMSALSPEVQADPRLALDGGEDGLTLIRALLPQTAALTQSIILETGIDHAPLVANLAKEAGFNKITLHSDLTGRERFIIARH